MLPTRINSCAIFIRPKDEINAHGCNALRGMPGERAESAAAQR